MMIRALGILALSGALVLGLAVSNRFNSATSWRGMAWAAGENCQPLAAGSCARVAIMSGNHPPATCTTGDLFLDLDSSDDTNCNTTADNTLCVCTASNTWRQIVVQTTTSTSSSTTSSTSTTSTT